MKLTSKALVGSGLVTMTTVIMLLLTGIPLPAQEGGKEPVAVGKPQADDLFEQDPGFPECLGPEDPFCPSGTGSDGDDGSGGSDPFCMKCERTCDSTGVCGPTCEQVGNEESGRTSCTEKYDGAQPVYCEAFGNFCESIQVDG